MKVSVGQIYIEPGISFPFSHTFQRWLSDELTSVADDDAVFQARFPDFDLMIRISADVGLSAPLIKGPTVFAKDKHVEYSIFLPFEVIQAQPLAVRAAAESLLAGVGEVFVRAGVETAALRRETPRLVQQITTDGSMLKKAWPGSVLQ